MSTSQTRQRTRSVSVPLTEDERAAIEREAAGAGQSLGGYMREKVLGTATPGTRRTPAPEAAQLARLLGQLGKVGSNLNQLTRLANQRQLVPPPVLELCLREVGELTQAVAEALHRDH
jgi:hypothetical protein